MQASSHTNAIKKTPACVGNGHSIIPIHSFVFIFYINKKEIHSKQQRLWEQKNIHSRTRWIRVLHHCRIKFSTPESYILWICDAFIYKFYILMQVSLLYIWIDYLIFTPLTYAYLTPPPRFKFIITLAYSAFSKCIRSFYIVF